MECMLQREAGPQEAVYKGMQTLYKSGTYHPLREFIHESLMCKVSERAFSKSSSANFTLLRSCSLSFDFWKPYVFQHQTE